MGNPLQQSLANILDSYEIDELVLGEGSYGSVRKAVNKSTGATVAVKSISKKQQPNYQNEIAIFKSMDHPHIIKLHDSFEGLSKVHFVFELCSGGDLYDRVMERNTSTRPGHFDEEETAIVMKCIFDAVAYMHKNHICHRDLKLENVMCTTKESIRKTNFQVIDFGTACKFADGEELAGKAGSNHYLAPQVFEGQYDCSADLWSLGVMSFVLLCGRYPFKGKTDVLQGKLSFEGAVWKGVSEDAKNLVRKLLMVDPEDRYTAEEALKDDWVEHMSGLASLEALASVETDENDCLEAWSSPRFAVGDRVEVKASVKEPQLGWSDVQHGQVGVITSIDEDGVLNIDFEHFDDWGADPSDMQHAKVETCSTRSS